MERKFAEEWLGKLKNYWFNKEILNAIYLFKNTTYYQETPFSVPYTTFEEITEEWQHIKNQDIKNIEFKILAIEDNTLIVNWIFKRDVHEFNGIYEIKFNENNECIYFKSWEVENCE